MEWIALNLEKEIYSENWKKNSAIHYYIKKMP